MTKKRREGGDFVLMPLTTCCLDADIIPKKGRPLAPAFNCGCLVEKHVSTVIKPVNGYDDMTTTTKHEG